MVEAILLKVISDLGEKIVEKEAAFPALIEKVHEAFKAHNEKCVELNKMFDLILELRKGQIVEELDNRRKMIRKHQEQLTGLCMQKGEAVPTSTDRSGQGGGQLTDKLKELEKKCGELNATVRRLELPDEI